jgi:hypothetical protein
MVSVTVSSPRSSRAAKGKRSRQQYWLTCRAPQRISVHVPSEVLRKHGYALEIIDTKGIDRAAIRPDLQACIDDPRCVAVLCSKFSQAPDDSLQGIIEHVRDRGATQAVRKRVMMLVLAHDSEALGMKDDSGVLAETEAEGYELKREHVAPS